MHDPVKFWPAGCTSDQSYHCIWRRDGIGFWSLNCKLAIFTLYCTMYSMTYVMYAYRDTDKLKKNGACNTLYENYSLRRIPSTKLSFNTTLSVLYSLSSLISFNLTILKDVTVTVTYIPSEVTDRTVVLVMRCFCSVSGCKLHKMLRPIAARQQWSSCFVLIPVSLLLEIEHVFAPFHSLKSFIYAI